MLYRGHQCVWSCNLRVYVFLGVEQFSIIQSFGQNLSPMIVMPNVTETSSFKVEDEI